LLGRSIRLGDLREGKATMRHPEGSRFERRLRARQLKRAVEGEILKHPLGDPRIGEDRRQAERRRNAMTPDEVADWLKRNGISGGDRRHNDRRQGDRRR
jgi:hypothetical protein